MKKTFFKKPASLAEWIFLAIATPIVLSSPYGARRFVRELTRYLEENSPAEKPPQHELEPGKVSQTIYRLKKRKIIDISEKDGKICIKLTEKGKRKRQIADIKNLSIEKPPAWDHKWRMMMFDIPEHHKDAREMLRNKLKKLGLFQFQKSVWIYPHDYQKEVLFIADILDVSKYITFIVVQIENDRPLRKFFQLD